MQQWQHGNTGPRALWNKRESSRCPKSRWAEQGDVHGSLRVQSNSGNGSGSSADLRCDATSRPDTSLDRNGRRPQDDQRNRLERIQNVHLGGPGKLIGADDPRHTLQENGGLADVPLYQQPFDAANVKKRAERNPQKNRSHRLRGRPGRSSP